ncbi:MAG: recombinase family protein [Candidatus Gastranaerophilales bacterium]|nr:recombinase family protein [Candidatus Gastranaerophilales bacterium]
MNKKVVRCAIYTRKSSEEGLEQDFNSLDAQCEACEAYIKSQQHEGWILIDKQYNDGGFSGGNIERPAIKELFQDIQHGKVDTVLVYKIDRLTRSLMDFSKIVEIFDKQSVTFVSITQQFNTTTSMGRLTLNILLSFAQFEREVTGERIRDKKAASRKKGMWTGGPAAIGYKIENKKLIPEPNGTKTIRTIFEKYLELKSVPNLKYYLDENEIKTKNGKSFSRGNLYRILSNKTYIGLVSHKGEDYKGEHDGIIDEKVFVKVQELLAQNCHLKQSLVTRKSGSFLSGKLFDDKGNKMTPSHSNTRNKRYRYYVSQAVLQCDRQNAGSISKVPAEEIENCIKTEVDTFLKDEKTIQTYISELDIAQQKEILQKLSDYKVQNDFAREVLSKAILYSDRVKIILCKNRLLKTIANIQSSKEDEAIEIIKNIQIHSTSQSGALIIDNAQSPKAKINPFLVKIIAKSYYWNKLLDEGKAKSSKDIQLLESLNDSSYIRDVLRLRFLSPRITESILEGRQPADLTVQKLFKVKTLDWAEQETLIKLR